jgi:hypothetical protein
MSKKEPEFFDGIQLQRSALQPTSVLGVQAIHRTALKPMRAREVQVELSLPSEENQEDRWNKDTPWAASCPGQLEFAEGASPTAKKPAEKWPQPDLACALEAAKRPEVSPSTSPQPVSKALVDAILNGSIASSTPDSAPQ